ncbi:MAG: glutamate 5-kinase [Chlamydiales bacterium]|nr:glutamate 5-kinase [Chlamydiales bacterium]
MRKVVIKFGTSSLTGGEEAPSSRHMVEYVRQIAAIHKEGSSIVLVSSGAIAAGRSLLPSKDTSIPTKQMQAAVGQLSLIRLWDELFSYHKIRVAQILITKSDLEDPIRSANARATLEALLARNVIPIINENDSVATEEIRSGDNDQLSAYIASLIEADQLFLLTDQEGLFTQDPRLHHDAKILKVIDIIDEKILELATASSSNHGTGGMETKLKAAAHAQAHGIEVVIASAFGKEVLLHLHAGKQIGTRFGIKNRRTSSTSKEI